MSKKHDEVNKWVSEELLDETYEGTEAQDYMDNSEALADLIERLEDQGFTVRILTMEDLVQAQLKHEAEDEGQETTGEGVDENSAVCSALIDSFGGPKHLLH